MKEYKTNLKILNVFAMIKAKIELTCTCGVFVIYGYMPLWIGFEFLPFDFSPFFLKRGIHFIPDYLKEEI